MSDYGSLEEKFYSIYILECSNGAFYIGYTTDIERRYREHQAGSAKCKYTRSFPPVKLSVYWKINATISSILKIERYLKTFTRVQKQVLIREPKKLEQMLLRNHQLGKYRIKIDENGDCE